MMTGKALEPTYELVVTFTERGPKSVGDGGLWGRVVSRMIGFLVAVVAVLTTAACATEPPAPVVIGSAPATPTGRIDLSGPVEESGFFAADAWPRACELLTDADLVAVFPQATGIARAGASSELTVLPDLRSEVYTARSIITIPEASCVIRFSLPGLELDPDLPLTTTSTGYAITVGVGAAGSEEVIVANTEFRPSRVRTLGTVGCDDSDFSEILCTAPRMRFSVIGREPCAVLRGGWFGDGLRVQITGQHV